MKTVGVFEHFVDSYYDMYLDAIEEQNQNSVDFCLDQFKPFKLKNPTWLKKLDVNSLLFFVAFNEDARLDPDITEYACNRALKEDINLHIFSAYLANSSVLMWEEYETVYKLLKLLVDKVDADINYSYELPYLRLIKQTVGKIEDECRQGLVEMNWVDEYRMSKEMGKMIKTAISQSARHKAFAEGWSIIK